MNGHKSKNIIYSQILLAITSMIYSLAKIYLVKMLILLVNWNWSILFGIYLVKSWWMSVKLCKHDTNLITLWSSDYVSLGQVWLDWDPGPSCNNTYVSHGYSQTETSPCTKYSFLLIPFLICKNLTIRKGIWTQIILL